jgi:hypothetical protein
MPPSNSAKARGREAINPFASRTGLNPITPGMEAATRDLLEDEPSVQIVEKEVRVEVPVEVRVEVPVEVPTPVLWDEHGIGWVGNFGICGTGLYVNANAQHVSEQEWRDFFEVLRQIKTAYQFVVGDWAAFGLDALEKSYAEIAEMTGYAPTTIENWASVCRRVPQFMRINSLDFAHHQVVMSLPEAEQSRWLKFAAEYKLPYRELARRIAENDTTPPPPQQRQIVTSATRFMRAVAPFESRALGIAAKASTSQRAEMAAHLRALADRIERGE